MAENGGVVNNSGTFPDYVEIQNTGGSPVNLAGWSLTDDGNARKFVFPGGTQIPAGGYLVVWCDDTNQHTPGIHSRFYAATRSDNVYLFDPATNRVDALTFGLQLTNHSVGRIGGEWVLTLADARRGQRCGISRRGLQLSITNGRPARHPARAIGSNSTTQRPSRFALRGCYLSNTSPSTASHPSPSSRRLDSCNCSLTKRRPGSPRLQTRGGGRCDHPLTTQRRWRLAG